MSFFTKECESDNFIVSEDYYNDKDNLLFLISRDNIANCFGFLLNRKDIEELRDCLTNWLEKD